MINISNKNISRRGIFASAKPKEIEQPKQKKRRFTVKLKKFSFKKKESVNKSPTNTRNKKTWVISSLAALLIIVGGAGYAYYYYLYQNNPSVIYQKRLHTITQSVSTQMSLPTDETPVTATVTDASKLPNELFFKNAENGDKIIMYKKHKLAILFRPSTGKVITEATLEYGDVTPTPAPQIEVVAGASTSAQAPSTVTVTPAPTTEYVPQGKVLVQPPQQ